jgi:hypothetical protein
MAARTTQLSTAVFPPGGQFLTNYERKSTFGEITDFVLRMLIGSTGAITSYSHKGQGHIQFVYRVGVAVYVVYLDGVYYVNPLGAKPFVGGVPQVIGTYSTTDGTHGNVIADTTDGKNQRLIAHHASDAVVGSTRTWTIGNGAFTQADIGATIAVSGSVSNDGQWTIQSVTSGTVVVTTESPTDETFGSTQAFNILGTYLTIEFCQSGTGAAAEVLSGNEVLFPFSLTTAAP